MVKGSVGEAARRYAEEMNAETEKRADDYVMAALLSASPWRSHERPSQSSSVKEPPSDRRVKE